MPHLPHMYRNFIVDGMPSEVLNYWDNLKPYPWTEEKPKNLEKGPRRMRWSNVCKPNFRPLYPLLDTTQRKMWYLDFIFLTVCVENERKNFYFIILYKKLHLKKISKILAPLFDIYFDDRSFWMKIASTVLQFFHQKLLLPRWRCSISKNQILKSGTRVLSILEVVVCASVVPRTASDTKQLHVVTCCAFAPCA